MSKSIALLHMCSTAGLLNLFSLALYQRQSVLLLRLSLLKGIPSYFSFLLSHPLTFSCSLALPSVIQDAHQWVSLPLIHQPPGDCTSHNWCLLLGVCLVLPKSFHFESHSFLHFTLQNPKMSILTFATLVKNLATEISWR